MILNIDSKSSMIDFNVIEIDLDLDLSIQSEQKIFQKKFVCLEIMFTFAEINNHNNE